MQDRCAPGDPSSGVAALREAGFTPTRAAQQAGYFLCRIDGKPATDPCQRASPADAYWSYWYAEPGGTWKYRGSGPADADPAPGSVEGWAFGDGKAPSVPPPARTSQRGSASPASTSRPVGPRSAAPPRTRADARSAAPRATASSAPSAGQASGAQVPAPQPVSPSPRAADLQPLAPTSSPTPEPVVAQPVVDDGGPGAGLVVGALAIVLIGGAAAIQSRRRR